MDELDNKKLIDELLTELYQVPVIKDDKKGTKPMEDMKIRSHNGHN